MTDVEFVPGKEPLLLSVARTSGDCTLRDGNRIRYEMHGNGPEHILLVMGLLASRFSWRETLNHFMSKPGGEDKYSILIFDNRGIGASSAPWGRYTTAMLAADCLDLLDHVGWTEERGVHVNGVSMGGMISLELALIAGSRMRSLTLTSTCAKHQNPPRTRAESLKGWVEFFKPTTSDDAKVVSMISQLFSDEDWLNSTHESGLPNRTRVERVLLNRIKQGIPHRMSGQIGQISACLTHNCSFSSLAKIGEIVPDTLIITGAADKLIAAACSEEMYREISNRGTQKSIRKVVYPKKGHALPFEAEEEYHREFEAIMDAGNHRWRQPV